MVVQVLSASPARRGRRGAPQQLLGQARSGSRRDSTLLIWPTAKRNSQVKNESIRLCVVLLVAVTGLFVIASGCDGISKEQPTTTPFKIGLLLNFTGSPEASADRKRAFDLAIRHINEGGGVLGMPVQGVAADATQDPSAAVEAARHLVEGVSMRQLAPKPARRHCQLHRACPGPLVFPQSALRPPLRS